MSPPPKSRYRAKEQSSEGPQGSVFKTANCIIQYALREKRPDEFGGYHERAVAEWHAFLKYARYAGDYHSSEKVKRLAGMSAELWEEIGIGLGLGEDEVASRIEADGRSVQSLESVREKEQATDWMKRHIGKM